MTMSFEAVVQLLLVANLGGDTQDVVGASLSYAVAIDQVGLIVAGVVVNLTDQGHIC